MSIKKQNIIDTITGLELDTDKILLQLFTDSFSKFGDDIDITYKTNIPDPFLMISKPTETKPYNLDNLYDWYLTKNTTFRETGQTIRDANPIVPEFKITLALVLKDIMLLLITNTFPKADENDNDNVGITDFGKCSKYIKRLSGKEFVTSENQEFGSSIINEVLTQLHDIIKNGYHYLEIIELIINYFILFNFGHIDESLINSNCRKYLNTLRNLSDTYFMIYPSFLFISYTKILYFLQAPVLMLKMSNIRELTDDIWMSPIIQIFHDITIHSEVTHCFVSKDDKSKTSLHTETTNLYRNIDNLYDNVFRRKFAIIKKYINVNYSKLNSDDLLLSIPERIKYYIAYILFLFLHEGDNTNTLRDHCTVLYINNLETSLLKILDTTEYKQQSSVTQKNSASKMIKDVLIKRLLQNLDLSRDDTEFKRFTLINNTDNKNATKDNNQKKRSIAEKSYDIFKKEIGKMFDELKSLESANTHKGGYKHKTSRIKTQKNTKKLGNAKIQTYYTLGQGRNVFLVKIQNEKLNKNIEVYAMGNDSKYDQLVLKSKIESYMLGKCIFKTCDHPHGELGNTILAKLPNGTRYLFIGEKAFEFDIGEVILEYGSPIGNADTAYPYARTANKTILFLEEKIIDNDILAKYTFNEKDKLNDDPLDPYYYFYGKFETTFDKQRKINKEMEKLSTPLKQIKTYKLLL